MWQEHLRKVWFLQHPYGDKRKWRKTALECCVECVVDRRWFITSSPIQYCIICETSHIQFISLLSIWTLKHFFCDFHILILASTWGAFNISIQWLHKFTGYAALSHITVILPSIKPKHSWDHLSGRLHQGAHILEVGWLSQITVYQSESRSVRSPFNLMWFVRDLIQQLP